MDKASRIRRQHFLLVVLLVFSLYQFGYAQDPTQTRLFTTPSPSSMPLTPEPSPTFDPGNNQSTTSVGNICWNSTAVVLGCLLAGSILMFIATFFLLVVLSLNYKKISKSDRVICASNPVTLTEKEAFTTTKHRSVIDVVYELADGPSSQEDSQTQQQREMSYSFLSTSNEENQGRAKNVPEGIYLNVASFYGKLEQKSQYMNFRFPPTTVPSVEDRKKMAVDDDYDDIYTVCTRSDDLKEDIYWKPGVTKEQLYNQMSQKKYQEIPVHCVTVKHQLGEGEFGQVCYGEWLSPFGPVEVAVKVSTDADSEDRVKLLQEAAIMGQFTHPKVVRMYGVITCVEPNMIVIEYLKNGNLLDHLNSTRDQMSHTVSAPVPVGLSQKLLQFCIEICDGLSYLSKKGFIHCDLATRNILLDKDYHCKIADFGMSKHLEEDSYYITKGGRIPLKWTAPEAILYRKYSTKSDVWSYGMVMYEIWSLGCEPFEDYTPQEVVDIFGSGFCLHPPPGCPRGIYSLMVKCWNPDHKKRCEMSEILTEFLTQRHALMLWNTEDKSVSPQADVLGAPLEEGKKLYKDLQLCYK